MNIRVVLADDHAIVREGLRHVLEREDDIVVVAEVSDGLQAVQAAGGHAPCVMVMDISMRGMNGIEATRRISAQTPSVRVLCLSMHAERQFVVETLDAGAAGYLLKASSSDELVLAVRTLAAGQNYVSPKIAGAVLEALTARRSGSAGSTADLLTPREREVIQLLAEGHSTKQIALRLGVSAKTVATHREHVMQKLEIESVAGITKYAIRHGLTTCDREGAP